MRDVLDVSGLLVAGWGMRGASVTPMGGGMNSETWLVLHDGDTYVAKAVPPDRRADLAAGAEVATTLARSGLATGHPVPTVSGRLLLEAGALALLHHVPGRELDGGTEQEQRWMADTLARVHRAGDPAPGRRTDTFGSEWLSPTSRAAQAEPWLEAVVGAVRAETGPLTTTWSVLHTDPTPEAFIHDDRSGVTGLVDWAGARRGPVLYDLASAVMYLGGPRPARAFLDSYLEEGPLPAGELRHLDAFRRFREAVQAVYFADRLVARDLTGGIEQADNRKGLDDARRRLAALDLET